MQKALCAIQHTQQSLAAQISGPSVVLIQVVASKRELESSIPAHVEIPVETHVSGTRKIPEIMGTAQLPFVLLVGDLVCANLFLIAIEFLPQCL